MDSTRAQSQQLDNSRLMVKRRFVFVSGHSRSGTTYVGDLFKTATNCTFFNQPFSMLFRAIKLRYYTENELDSINLLPLNNCFGARPYALEDFYSFLNEIRLNEEDFSRWRELRRNSICLQDELTLDTIDELETSLLGSRLDAFFKQALSRISYESLASNQEKRDVIGFKEILTAEFTPWFASKGWYVIHVFRHPSDVLRSSYFGNGKKFVGTPKSIMFYLNNWRESVQAAIHLRHYSEIVKFENVLDSDGILNQRFSRLLDFDFSLTSSIKNSNSSKVDLGNRTLQLIEKEMRLLIEPFALPEMILLGYEVLTKCNSNSIEEDFEALSAVTSEIADYLNHPIPFPSREDLNREKSRRAQMESAHVENESLFFSEEAKLALARIWINVKSCNDL